MENKNKSQKSEVKRQEIVIDASNAVLGRVASYAAKQSLLGKNVIIVNCTHALLSGRRRMVIEEYGNSRRRGGTSMNGPHFPKSAERIMKRTVRGMLSYTQKRGLDALKRIMCYNVVPKEYESAKKVSLETDSKAKTLTLGDLSTEI
jgi:large subunit ribosomal protein L13